MRQAQVLQRRHIPEPLWQATLDRYPFLGWRSAEDLAELRRLSSLFLDQKEFSGAAGFVVTDDMAVAIAAQACLPVLRLGLAPYASFVGIVLHAGEVVAAREVVDEDGIVHHYDEVLAGEAMEGGPVMLSWHDVTLAAESQPSAYNVVMHEFAHVIDMGDGIADGVPPLPGSAQRTDWLEVLMPAFDRFSERVVCGYETVIDPYGVQGPEEFFAVAVEAFFVTSMALKEEQPALYRLFASYFRQDPAETAGAFMP